MAKKYGDWTIVRSMTEGGQARIFEVKNSEDKCGVLKRLKNINRKDRFIREIEITKNNTEGFFPEIYQIDVEADDPYYVMEYFKNGCLRAEIIRIWDLQKKCDVFMRIIAAVAWAQVEGAQHRDLKPENILLDDDFNPKVSDWGLAYTGEFDQRLTLTDEAVGAFRFMAPELEDGRFDEVGNQADVYSLGKIAYWLFSGGIIYNREKHREPKYDLSRHYGSHWTHHLNDFLDKATNYSITERTPDCANLISEFSKVGKAMLENTRYLDLAVEQPCMFCGIGKYIVYINGLQSPTRHANTEAMNFGFRAAGDPLWLILRCNRCGNVQLFRKDGCPDWDWKE